MEEKKQSPIQKAFVVEIALLKALAVQYNHKSYIDYVVKNRLLEETQTLLEAYELYYDMYPEHTKIQWDLFRTQFVTNWHARDIQQNQIDLFCAAIDKIANADEVEAETALIGLVNKQFLDQINKLGEKPFDGEMIKKELDKYEHKRASIIQDCDLDSYDLYNLDLSVANPEQGLPYAFDALNEACYGQVKGDLILLNAGTDVGKSAFLFTQIKHTLEYMCDCNIHEPIIFFNSEGSAEQWFGRLLSNIYANEYQEGYREVLRHAGQAKKNFFSYYGKDRILAFRGNRKGMGFIRNKIIKYKPSLVMVDMLKGVLPEGKTSELAVMEEGAQALRDISADHCPIWATVQAGEGARLYNPETKKLGWKKWLEKRDVRGDKDGMQGAASVIIGIGCHADPKLSTTRYIYTSKTKSEKPAKFICEIDFATSRYIEAESNRTWEDY